MRRIIFILAVFFSLCAKAQSVVEAPVYKYIIVTMNDADKKGKIKVLVDDGITNERLKDQDGNALVFKTKAGILMYFTNLGWEFVDLYTSTSGETAGGTGGTFTSGLWLFKKKSTKEEVQKILEQVVKD